MNAVVNLMDRTLDRIVTIICILLLLIGVYSILDNLWLFYNALDDSLLIYKPNLDEPLDPNKLISEDQVAWLTVDKTSIDYPVMQGKDNTTYLNRDPYGEFSLSGSIFLDSRNNSNFEDEYSIIYGHHMARGAMFGVLDEFKNKEFFEAHRKGRIVTKTTVYDYQLFAVTSAKANNQTMFDPEKRTTAEVLQYLKANAMIYHDPEPGLRFVAMSTCSPDAGLSRLLVLGTIKERSR